MIAERVRRWAADSPFFLSVLRAIDSADEGWKITILLRLSPLMPYALINYLLSSTQLPVWTYFWTSALGVLPPTALYVYLGTTAASLSDILGDAFEPPETDEPTAPSPPAPVSPIAAPSAMDTTQLWVMGIGVVITIAVAVLVTIFTSRAIKRASRMAAMGGVDGTASASVEDAILEGSSSDDEDLTTLDKIEDDTEHSVQMKELKRSTATGTSSPLSSSVTSDTELLDGHTREHLSVDLDDEDSNQRKISHDKKPSSSSSSSPLSDSYIQLDATPFSFSHSPTNSRISLADSQASV